ncbi:tRNA pseudouridine32 synthase / 23S rRNA pseudouridine746 synthase [Solimonas aquatica]|uniref:tRNA pseudouridine32 synthase / 23S rRNA pseudouridine746 synthase n=1 Tax=Solimonas aquatica TaxID=489703 RepID=A0A1H9EIC6_9GAMM|nr:RluA family pseudouridine synthase [Solimonas aquatica]SEQ25365.1 tRNA pseudouridine32 synthase / 23S rRNA pseudouridine746 synthase [Solimonas aquatica]
MQGTPPLREGVGASTVRLPPGAWRSVLDFLVQHFADVGEANWRSRFARGLVLNEQGRPLTPDAPYVVGARLHYYRELPPEPVIPFTAKILFQDEQLLVADKPHFLPVLPSGRFVQETLLVRLKRELGLAELTPLHRIDRETAGLVLFSCQAATRGRYQALFAQRLVEKTYEAIAPMLPQLRLPYTHKSRMVEGEPFFRMREVVGEANSETRIELLERRGLCNLYRLLPVTGRKHQLRVHLAGLGAPILNDSMYPQLQEREADDYSRPLQLLARGLRFIDPLSGQLREFESERVLT